MTEGIATFVYPPGSFTGSNGQQNKHPMRVYQFSQQTMSCPRGTFVLMAIMQLEDDSEESISPFMEFIKQKFPTINLSKKFKESAKEIFTEEEEQRVKNERSNKPKEDGEGESKMKTESELVEAKKKKEEERKEIHEKDDDEYVEDNDPVQFAVMYLQERVMIKEPSILKQRFTNVVGFKDADFDMDLDACFYESESMFHDTLGIPKKADDAEESEDVDDDSDDEKKDAEEETKKDDKGEDTNKDQTD